MQYADYDSKDCPSIFSACKNGDAKKVERFLNESISVYIDHPDCLSLAAIAIGFSQVEVLRVLISKGWDVNHPLNRFGETPLFRAIGMGNCDIIRELIKGGADLHNATTPPLFAAVAANVDALKLLIELGVDIHAKDQNGRTGLIEAAVCNKLDSLDILWAAGVRLEDRDGRGSTALICASKRGSYNACKWLLEHGADIHAKDERGKTSLDWARVNGHAKVVELLHMWSQSKNGNGLR